MAAEFSNKNEQNPDNILPSYAVPVLWNCTDCGFIWSSTVKERVNGKTECPYCAGSKPIPGKTSFKAIYPEMAVEFSVKNEQDPDKIIPTYSDTVLWNCPGWMLILSRREI